VWQSRPVRPARFVLMCVLLGACLPGLAALERQGAPARSSAPNGSQLAETFLRDLQDAVGRRDHRAVAAMVQYPAKVKVKGLLVPVPDVAGFLKLYDAVFTPELEDLLARSGVTRAGNPRPKYPVIITRDGLMLGTSVVAARRIRDSFKIVRIIVPPSSPNRALRRPPIRVEFLSDRPAALFSGLLEQRDEVQPYLLHAAKGRVIQATIDRFRGRDVAVRVVDQNGKPLVARSRDWARTWTGIAPEDADYLVEVERLAPTEAGTLSFTLAIAAR
jgi:hypothetical protein